MNIILIKLSQIDQENNVVKIRYDKIEVNLKVISSIIFFHQLNKYLTFNIIQ